MSEKKTVLGIGENIEAALCYVFGFLTGIFFLLMEKENKFIRFHALQSMLIFLGGFIFISLIGWIPIVGWLISMLSVPLGIILAVFLMSKAYQGELFKLPKLGDFAEKKIFGENS
ncbi:MAG: hypothetical protein R6V17_02780 [Halanaerobacter sp.]